MSSAERAARHRRRDASAEAWPSQSVCCWKVCGEDMAVAFALLFVSAFAVTSAQPGVQPNSKLLPEDCGTEYVNLDRIRGGSVAVPGQFPWLALLEYKSANGQQGFLCGGAVINDRYVLTAAHCLVEPKGGNKLIGVRLGDQNVSTEFDCLVDEQNGKYCADPAIDFGFEEVILHPNYTGNPKSYSDDIGLIRLDQKLIFSDYIRPICLAGEAQQNITYEGKQLETAGWGRTDAASMSDIKLYVALPVTNLDECVRQFKAAGQTVDPRKQMCAGGQPGKDSCKGDSGGPLVANASTSKGMRSLAVGVASYGTSPCGLGGWPGIYTRVSAYHKWILDNIKP